MILFRLVSIAMIFHFHSNLLTKTNLTRSHVQCCQVKGNEEEVNHEEHREHEEKKEILDKILRELRVLRGEKFLIVRHWTSLAGSGCRSIASGGVSGMTKRIIIISNSRYLSKYQNSNLNHR